MPAFKQTSSSVTMGRCALTKTRCVMVNISVRTVLMNCSAQQNLRDVFTTVTTRISACLQTCSVMERGTVQMAQMRKTVVGDNDLRVLIFYLQ